MEKWTDWPVEIHNSAEQVKRIDDSFMTLLSDVDPVSETARAENGYAVSLTKCTCGDFIKRHQPCEHMYRLAYELDRLMLSKSAERSTELIADFKTGFARNWSFAVGTCFWSALDIRYTERKFNGKKALIPTQGYNYTFEHGMTFYDNPAAYMIWNEALKNFKICIEVQKAYPNKKTYSFKYENGVLYGEADYEYGTVVLDIYAVNAEKTGIKKVGYVDMRADEFVNLLISGEAYTTTNRYFNIYKFVNDGGNLASHEKEEKEFLEAKYNAKD